MEIMFLYSQFMFAFKGIIKTVADFLSQADYWKIISGFGSICGIISLFAYFFDKYCPPSVKILGIRPIITITKILNTELQDKGFHAIIQLKSKGRPVMINGMIIKGKVYLSGNYSMAYLDHKNNIDNYTEEYCMKKPYVNVEWTSLLTDSNLPIKIESHERRYIRVTFLESHLDGTEIDQAFVGYDDGTKQPSRTMIKPSLLFNDLTKDPDNFNNIKNGPVEFELQIGSKNVPIPKNKIVNGKTIPKEEWDKFAIDILYKDN